MQNRGDRMTELLKVIDQKGNVVGEVERNENGRSQITIKDLEPGTTYSKGTFKIVSVSDNGESDYTDVPEFKTKQVRKRTKAQK